MALTWTLLALGLASCAAEPPPRYEVLHLSGTPYQRGLQHGRQMSSKIKSFYTTMLATSLLPYLDRERAGIAAYLTSYADDAYGNGQFSLKLLRESAVELEKSIPQRYLDEMHGVADGSGVAYVDVLVLNTFFDSVLGARAITYFLQQMDAPQLKVVEVLAPALLTDGLDNNGDGKTDEAGEGRLDPYQSSATASLVGIPLDAQFRFTLQNPQGVDAKSVRVMLGTQLFTPGSAGLTVTAIGPPGDASQTVMQVDLVPPQPLPGATAVFLSVQASGLKIITDTPPDHPRTIRNEQITFGTAGLAATTWQLANRGVQDSRTQPPSIGFALRGTATKDGKPLLAHHFSLLDAGTSHKHTVIQIHHPDSGPDFMFPGWAGIVWGLSGINAEGLSFAVNMSDTLNNPLVGRVKEALFNPDIGLDGAKLLSSGLPVGFVARSVLESATTAAEAEAQIKAAQQTFGWMYLVADKAGAIVLVETNSNILGAPDTPASYTPDPSLPGNVDGHGQPWASVGPDDLRMSVAFRKLADDLTLNLIAFKLKPQRFWTSYFFTATRAFATLGDAIEKNYGQFDAQRAIQVLRQPGLFDHNDSMNAAIYEPATRTMRAALGVVPATDAPFDVFQLAAPGAK